MFSGECSGCGSGLRERDRKCRLCGQDISRGGGQSRGGSPFAETEPAVEVVVPMPTSFAAAALAPPTLTQQLKAARPVRSRKAAAPPK
jgi:hypothetical protein